MNTIHKDVSTILNKLIAGLVLLACSTVSQANTVSLTPVSDTVSIGTGTVVLDLVMDFNEATSLGTTRVTFAEGVFLDLVSFTFDPFFEAYKTDLPSPGAGDFTVADLVLGTGYFDVKLANLTGIAAGAYNIGTMVFNSLADTVPGPATQVMLFNGVGGESWIGPFGATLGSEPNFSGANITIGTTAMPVPAAVWLFGSGLIGLVGVARRRNSV